MTKKHKLQLTFKNVTITAPLRRRCCGKNKVKEGVETERVILDNLSGTVMPGDFLSIIGASGAGKTTLLNYLSAKDASKNLKKKG